MLLSIAVQVKSDGHYFLMNNLLPDRLTTTIKGNIKLDGGPMGGTGSGLHRGVAGDSMSP